MLMMAAVALLFGMDLAAQQPGEKGFVYPSGARSISSSPSSWRPTSRLEFDFAALQPDAKFRAANSAGTQDIDWKGDGLDDDPFQWMGGIRASIVSSDRSSIGFMWQGTVLAAYPSSFPRNVASGPSTIPAGSDLDTVVQVHALSAWWRRDWVVGGWGVLGAGSWYSMLGLGYDIVSMTIDSDGFPVAQGKHRMSHMIPMPMVGVGFEVMGKSNLFRMEARAAFLPEMTTLQKARGDDVKQSSASYELSALYEFGLSEWMGFGLTGRWVSISHELKAATLDQSVEITGPAVGVRFSFRF